MTQHLKSCHPSLSTVKGASAGVQRRPLTSQYTQEEGTKAKDIWTDVPQRALMFHLALSHSTPSHRTYLIVRNLSPGQCGPCPTLMS
jgi:hypothetical protein